MHFRGKGVELLTHLILMVIEHTSELEEEERQKILLSCQNDPRRDLIESFVRWARLAEKIKQNQLRIIHYSEISEKNQLPLDLKRK